MALSAQVDTKDSSRIVFSEPIDLQHAITYLWGSNSAAGRALRPDPGEPSFRGKQRSFIVKKDDMDVLLSMQHGLANEYLKRLKVITSNAPAELPKWIPQHVQRLIFDGRVRNGVTHFPGTYPWGDIVVWLNGSGDYLIVEAYQEFPDDFDYYLKIVQGDKYQARLLRNAYTAYNKDMHYFVDEKGMRPDMARSEIRRINDEVFKLIIEGAVAMLNAGMGISAVGSSIRASSKRVVESMERTGFARDAEDSLEMGGIRVELTENEGAAVGRLQGALRKGQHWSDLAASDRRLLGNLFHKVVEPLADFIFRGVGRTLRRAKIDPRLIAELRRNGGRVLITEGEMAAESGRTLRVDLAEINFAEEKVTVIDLTSVERTEHVAKTVGYRDSLSKLTGFKADAMEMRYVGDDDSLLEILTEAQLRGQTPAR